MAQQITAESVLLQDRQTAVDTREGYHFRLQARVVLASSGSRHSSLAVFLGLARETGNCPTCDVCSGSSTLCNALGFGASGRSSGSELGLLGTAEWPRGAPSPFPELALVGVEDGG